MAIGAYFTLALKSRLNSRVIVQYFTAMHGRSRLPKVGVSNPASHFLISQRVARETGELFYSLRRTIFA